MAWRMFESMREHFVTECGFAGVRDVQVEVPVETADQVDRQQSFFLAETLKYLFLIFSPTDVWNTNEWIFNTEAHPLHTFDMI
mmetsp:Transcript_4691/g.11304  ORF Transcript_4691/g.11304 Transcript_4691/m.11304 type:complete len:83 (-) Transcript_4691:19-267(-)